jgi:hypothetical protein
MHIIEALVFGVRGVFVCALRFTGERDARTPPPLSKLFVTTKLTDLTFDLGVIDLTALDHFRRGIPGIFCHLPRPVAAYCEPVHRHGRA